MKPTEISLRLSTRSILVLCFPIVALCLVATCNVAFASHEQEKDEAKEFIDNRTLQVVDNIESLENQSAPADPGAHDDGLPIPDEWDDYPVERLFPGNAPAVTGGVDGATGRESFDPDHGDGIG